MWPISVSYDNSKMRLKWADAGVTVSPELKLLQYHIRQPLQLAEKDIYTNEKSGRCIHITLTKNRVRSDIFL